MVVPQSVPQVAGWQSIFTTRLLLPQKMRDRNDRLAVKSLFQRSPKAGPCLPNTFPTFYFLLLFYAGYCLRFITHLKGCGYKFLKTLLINTIIIHRQNKLNIIVGPVGRSNIYDNTIPIIQEKILDMQEKRKIFLILLKVSILNNAGITINPKLNTTPVVLIVVMKTKLNTE